MFTKRKDEVHKKLDDAAKSMTGRDISPLKEQQLIRDAVNKYFYLRQGILEQAIECIKDDTKTADQHRNRWESHLQTKGNEAVRILIDSLKDKRITLFTVALSEVISQETAFYYKLANMQLADTMKAKPQEYKKQFEEEKKNLQDRWDKLVYENKHINTAMEEVSKQVIDIYKKGLEKVNASHVKLREEVSKSMKVAKETDESMPSPPSIIGPLSLMIETLNQFMVTSKDLAYRFDNLYRSEENVAVIMYGNTRRSVKDFLEKTNLDKAQRDYYAAEKHAFDVAANMLTNAQKEDASLFVTTGAEIAKRSLTAFTDAYNAFVDAFKEIFIGPVGDRNVNDLIKKERWDWARGEWQRMNIQTELKKIYDDSREWVSIDIYNFTPETRYEIETALKKDRARLELALNQAGDPSVMDALKMFLTISKENIFSKLKNI